MRQVWNDLELSYLDRVEQNVRVAQLASIFSDQGFEVVVATICPYRALRKSIKDSIGCQFILIEGGKSGKDYPFEP